MSNARIADASIKGLHGPYFDGLEPVQALYGKHPERINQGLIGGYTRLWAAAGQQPHEAWTGATSDGYVWPFVIPFRFYNRWCQVMLPGVNDREMTDGTYADRHTALYYQGRPLSEARLSRLSRKAASLLEDAYEGMYGSI